MRPATDFSFENLIYWTNNHQALRSIHQDWKLDDETEWTDEDFDQLEKLIYYCEARIREQFQALVRGFLE